MDARLVPIFCYVRSSLLVLIFCFLSNGVAQAHPVAQGRLEIEIFPDKIHARAQVSTEEVFVQNALSSRESAETKPDELYQRHGSYLLEHIRFSADEKPLAGRLTAVVTPHGPGVQRAIYDFELVLPAPPARLRIDENVLNEFDYAPGNRWEATYVTRVAQQGRQPVEGLLLTSREPLVIDCIWSTSTDDTALGAARLDRWRLTKDYVRHGVMHILTGYDHLLFISALVLAVVTLWDLVKVITAFTLAHSITLTLSVLNIVRLPGKIVEPMIAVSIIFVALQNVFWPQRTRGAARLGIAFFFGLFHGLGFAGGLLAAMEGMAGLTIGLAIVAFSVGIEIGHQIVVLPIFCALKIARTLRTGSIRPSEYALRYGSVAICAAGIFYLITALR